MPPRIAGGRIVIALIAPAGQMIRPDSDRVHRLVAYVVKQVADEILSDDLPIRRNYPLLYATQQFDVPFAIPGREGEAD